MPNTQTNVSLTSAITPPRIDTIDVLRGLIIVIMLFDHVRENFFAHVAVNDPLAILGSDLHLFFTRIAAHFCAPLFVFLTGLSAWLYANPPVGVTRTEGEVTAFLLKRGGFLLLLELTVVNFSWYGKLPPTTIFLQVIWVIGLSVIALAVLHRLPKWLLGTIALLLVAGHNLLTPIQFSPQEFGYNAWTLLHDRGFLQLDLPIKVKVSYPLLPWIGVILLGYLAGPLFGRGVTVVARQRALRWFGALSLAALAVLRGLNIYGETQPWVSGETWLHAVMSWVNFTKYPPSLNFLLFTLGLGCLLLAALDGWTKRHLRMKQALRVFGSVPMFFYVAHLYLLLILQTILLATIGATHGTRIGVDHYWQIWIISFLLLPILYFPCRRFAKFKRSTKLAWVRYF